MKPLEEAIASSKETISQLRSAQKDKKPDEISQEDKDKLASAEKQEQESEQKENAVLTDFATQNRTIRQLVDLALLSNNMLKGEALSNFIKRSVELMK